MDTSIYLGIADAVPGLPEAGANYVFHGSQRILYPFVLGLLAKAVGVTSWTVFQWAVHILTFLTTGMFWQIALRVTANRFRPAVFLTTMLVCSPFLFRLQMTFSGFVNDAFFNFGLSILTFAILTNSWTLRIVALALILPAKQTVFLIVPALLMADMLFPTRSRKSIAIFWCVVSLCTALYYALVNQIIGPFSSPNSTAMMAFGFIHWLMSASWPLSAQQLATFLSRGILGLLMPLGVFLAAVLARTPLRISLLSHNEKILVFLFLGTIAQPLISGPSITDASIQRLLSVGLIPLLACMGPVIRNIRWQNTRVFSLALLAMIVGATHHLFSRIGPDLTLRYYFLVFYASGSCVVAYLTWRGLLSDAVDHN